MAYEEQNSRPFVTAGLGITTLRTTLISPAAGTTELPNTVTDPAVAHRVSKLYADVAIPANWFARAIAVAMGQPEDVDSTEILYRPTRQEW